MRTIYLSDVDAALRDARDEDWFGLPDFEPAAWPDQDGTLSKPIGLVLPEHTPSVEWGGVSPAAPVCLPPSRFRGDSPAPCASCPARLTSAAGTPARSGAAQVRGAWNPKSESAQLVKPLPGVEP